MDDHTSNPVAAAIRSRRSVRAFLPREVPEETVRAILETAARAPSGTNTQPWRVYVLRGEAKDGLSRRILAAYGDPETPAPKAFSNPTMSLKSVRPEKGGQMVRGLLSEMMARFERGGGLGGGGS